MEVDPGSGRAKRKSPAWRTAIELLALLSVSDGAVGTGEAVARLGAPRSTLNRLCRILARYELLDLSRHGRIALGRAALALGSRREDLMRVEDERRLAPRRKQLGRAPGASYSLIRNPDCSVVARTTGSRRSRKFRLGFSNASLDHPWRTALVHSVEYGAVRSNGLVSSFAVPRAARRRATGSRRLRAFEERGGRPYRQRPRFGFAGGWPFGGRTARRPRCAGRPRTAGDPAARLLRHLRRLCDRRHHGAVDGGASSGARLDCSPARPLSGGAGASAVGRRTGGLCPLPGSSSRRRLLDGVAGGAWARNRRGQTRPGERDDRRRPVRLRPPGGSARCAPISRLDGAGRSPRIQEGTSIWPTSSRSVMACHRPRSTIRRPWACALWKLCSTCYGVVPSLAAFFRPHDLT
jgi:hypothetical protein